MASRWGGRWGVEFTRAELPHIGWLLVAKASASCLVLALGFHAVSDDDFSRVFIAQQFAFAPRIDPSGSSWLPLPFWLHGGVMWALGESSFGVARGASFALGLCAALAQYLAGRWLGLSPRAALGAGLLACATPYIAIFGVATVPEGPTAAAILLGVSTLARSEISVRYAGALALLAATLSRYEAWPVAGLFALYCAVDAWRQRRLGLFPPGLLALVGALAWLLHAQAQHGNPLFFVERVVAYRRALGTSGQLLERLFTYPRGLIFGEPELLSLSLLAGLLAWSWGSRVELRAFRRPALLLGALLMLLICGELGDGAPTHHPERALAALWLLLTLLLGALIAGLWPVLHSWRRRACAGGLTCATLAAALCMWRPWYAHRDDFIDRRPALAIGAAARAHGARQLLVAAADFAFYAVLVGRADPSAARPLVTHDPRQPQEPDPLASAALLQEQLRAQQAQWLIAPRARAAVAAQAGTLVASNERWVLLRLAP